VSLSLDYKCISLNTPSVLHVKDRKLKVLFFYRFCHQIFDSNYKATIGVDFEVERFDILQVPFNLQM